MINNLLQLCVTPFALTNLSDFTPSSSKKNINLLHLMNIFTPNTEGFIIILKAVIEFLVIVILAHHLKEIVFLEHNNI